MHPFSYLFLAACLIWFFLAHATLRFPVGRWGTPFTPNKMMKFFLFLSITMATLMSFTESFTKIVVLWIPAVLGPLVRFLIAKLQESRRGELSAD